MNVDLQNPRVIFGIIAAVLLAGFVLSRGSGARTITTPGGSGQQNFQNALQLMQLDGQQRSTYVQALLSYDKAAKDFATSANTLTASTGLERARIQNAYLLGTKAIDSQQTVLLNTNQTNLQKAQMDNQTAQQNGILNFFGGLFGGVFKLLTGGL